MNKKVLYLIGALVGVAAVTLLMPKSGDNTSIALQPEAAPTNGLVSAPATVTPEAATTELAPISPASGSPATTPDSAGMPDSAAASVPAPAGTGVPAVAGAGGDELPAGAEVAPGQPDANTTDMEEGDDKVIPPSEGQ